MNEKGADPWDGKRKCTSALNIQVTAEDAGMDESFQRERSIKRGPKIDSQRKLFLPPKLILNRQGRRRKFTF